MCEIAVVDPERVEIQNIHQIAGRFHEQQGDGIGVLMVKHREDSFEYKVYKSTDPHWQTLYSFLRRNIDDTWRVVIHGRYGTAGNPNRQNTHPLHVDCPQCDFDWVVHNGSVRKHRKVRPGMISQGHEFNTPVDSEIIAHKVGSLPETVEEHDYSTYDMRGNLHYLLFNEDGILVRTTGKYSITDDFCMTCSRRSFDNAKEMGFEYSRNKWLLIEPGDDEPEIETKEGASRTSTYYTSGASRSGSAWQNYEDNARDDEQDTHTVEYVDYSDFDNVIAVQVAPGVMKIIEKTTDNVEYVYADQNPRLYYWYSPAEAPDDLDKLEQLAEEYGRVPQEQFRDEQQTTIQDFPEQRVMDAITDETMLVLQEEVMDNADVDEIVDIQESVKDAVARATDAAIEAATTG